VASSRACEERMSGCRCKTRSTTASGKQGTDHGFSQNRENRAKIVVCPLFFSLEIANAQHGVE